MAQGALVIQIKEANQRVREILEPIHDSATYLATVAERVLLATLAGGCLAPIGSWGRFEADGELSLGGCVLSDAGGNVKYEQRLVHRTCETQKVPHHSGGRSRRSS